LKALMEAVHNAVGVPLEAPEGDTVVKEVASGKFQGFVHHYNVIKKKIDCAGLDLKKIVEDIKNGK